MLAFGGTPMADGTQSQTDIAIKKLWSPNESERSEGVQALLRIGPASIEKLNRLLGELIHDQSPRFVPGREQEGERALQEYVRTARRLFSAGGEYDELIAAKARLIPLTLNSRLMTDVVHLLGELKAEQVVPLLMEMVNRNWESTLFGLEFDTPETKALARIGAAAVPPLIENLNEATIRAYGFEPLARGWRVVVAQEDDDEPDPDEKLFHQNQIGNVRLRVAFILGDIGDARALPYLEKLLAEIKSSPGSPVFQGAPSSLPLVIDEAIARIKTTGGRVERNATHTGQTRVMPINGDRSVSLPSSRKPE
jgi:HEAT repeat protein